MDKLHRMPGAWPFLLAMFINAFTDLGHKIIVQNTVFKMYDGSIQVVLTALVNGLMLLPFILLVAPAGYLSDARSKVRVMRWSAWAAVLITSTITLAYYAGWFWLAFAMTLLMAVQATFYSPAKFGFIKRLFGIARLGEGNGLVQAVSIIAILMGTFVFTALFEYRLTAMDVASPEAMLQQVAPLGWLLVLSSLLEVWLLYRLSDTDVPEQEEALDWGRYLHPRSAMSTLSLLRGRTVIRLSIIGLAVFWSVGQVMLAAFPAYAKATLNEYNTLVIQGILVSSGIGIALGSLLANRASRNHIETGLIPVGAMGIALGLWCLPLFDHALEHALNFVFIGLMGGLFIVPLNALIQFHAREGELGQVLACNNWVQNVAMLGFLMLTAVFALLGVQSRYLLMVVAMVALVGGGYTVWRLPQSLVRILLSFLIRRRYRICVHGVEQVPAEGGVLLLGNHISWVDWAMVQIACPRRVRFVMLKSIYERWYLRWLLKAMGCIPIQSGAGVGHSLETVAQLLDAGEVVCLFPEGSISRTGQLGEFRRGYERACGLARNNVVIVPFYLRGLWGSQFSRSSPHLKALRDCAMHRSVIVAFGQPLPKETKADVLKRRIFDQAMRSWQHYMEELPSLGDAWIDSVRRNPSGLALVDGMSPPLSAARALAASSAMARRFGRLSPEPNIGLLLPTSTGGVLANMAGLLAGKTLINLNYTASLGAMRSSLEQGEVSTIYTARRFVQRLQQRGMAVDAMLEGYQVVYLEDLRGQLGRLELMLRWMAVYLLPSWLLKLYWNLGRDASATAAILFSSGSEGAPKGVMLSHGNFMANIKQISDVLNTQHDDVVMASLPLFHAFGLTVTQLIPLIEGVPMVCHADPTDGLGIARAVATHRATIMFGTSTFLRLFVRNPRIEPLMLDSLRIVVAGAERLDEDVRQGFKLKFNKDIYEGYGATETAPVAAVNLPDALDVQYLQVQRGGKKGTVGMPLPGSSFKIINPDTGKELPTGEAGMILIGGPQVMQGYLGSPEKTAKAIWTLEGARWYVTGDKGFVDADGFLTIVDRYSRFAKIGGEMISLGAVEQAIREALTEYEINVLAVSLPDARKGERIVVLYEPLALSPDELRRLLRQAGCPPLLSPSVWLEVDHLPRLGSGKADFATAQQLAAALSADQGA